MKTKRVCVGWETNGIPIKETSLPTKVDVPNDIDNIVDWLSDKYGYLVNGFCICVIN